MKIDLIMPTRRHHHLATVQTYLEQALAMRPDVDLIWHLLTFGGKNAYGEVEADPLTFLEPLSAPLPATAAQARLRPWIKHHVCPARDPAWHDIMYLFNFGLDQVDRNDTWVWMGQDDNVAFPKGVFNHLAETVENYPDALVLVMNHNRGQRQVLHGASPLIARGDQMAVGSVSLEQYLIFQGVAHQQIHRYLNDSCGDGEMMARLYARMPAAFHFMTGTWIPFNALEEGRWDPPELVRALESCENGV